MDVTLDAAVLEGWIGRTETLTDRIDPGPARRMQATLDREPDLHEGDPLPPFWHYIYFNPETPASRLKQDGHDVLGRFLPPVALPRRMWAGGRVEITRPLVIGETCTKTSIIRGVEVKQGRSGALCFVTVDHDFSVDGERCFSERQNIVYREMPAEDSPRPQSKRAPENAAVSHIVRPDPVLLFRYSALIFYGHRIHYDIDYNRDVEGYPGLVVHGPLTATMLVALGVAQQPGKALRSLDIRALSPLFSPAPFHIEARNQGDVTETWARGTDGALALTVDLTFDATSEEG